MLGRCIIFLAWLTWINEHFSYYCIVNQGATWCSYIIYMCGRWRLDLQWAANIFMQTYFANWTIIICRRILQIKMNINFYWSKKCKNKNIFTIINFTSCTPNNSIVLKKVWKDWCMRSESKKEKGRVGIFLNSFNRTQPTKRF